MRSKQRAPSNHNKHAPLSLGSHPLYHSCDLLKTFFFLSSGLSVLCLPCCLVARLSLALRRHRLLGVCCCGFFPLGFVLFLCSLFSVVFNFSEPGSFSWPLFLPILPFSLRFCWWYWFFVCLFLPSLLRISSPPFSVFVSFFFSCSLFLPSFLLQTRLPDISQKLNMGGGSVLPYLSNPTHPNVSPGAKRHPAGCGTWESSL